MPWFFVFFAALFINGCLNCKDFKRSKIEEDIYVLYFQGAKQIDDYLSALESKNNSEAFFYHGLLLLDGTLGDVNAGLANYYFLKAIEVAKQAGDVETQKKAFKAIADSFYSGDGIDLITLRALDYYLASSKLNYLPAMFNVAVVYKEVGCCQKAIYWMKKYCSFKEAELKDYGNMLLKKWQKEAR
ncbi:MAG: hypothetical protein KBD31_01220 [Proteobacteria bacterium]|nr:hypothetical protein [Pseudomonadota bacterium]